MLLFFFTTTVHCGITFSVKDTCCCKIWPKEDIFLLEQSLCHWNDAFKCCLCRHLTGFWNRARELVKDNKPVRQKKPQWCHSSRHQTQLGEDKFTPTSLGVLYIQREGKSHVIFSSTAQSELKQEVEKEERAFWCKTTPTAR